MTIRKFFVAMMLALPLFGCGTGREREIIKNGDADTLVGGYTAQREPTKAEIALFSNAVDANELGLGELEPVSVATQVVAGLNYKFICNAAKEGSRKKDKVEVVIYRNLQGELSVSSARVL